MAEYRDYVDYVSHKLPARDLMEQLAEEASELSQAALKLIRALGQSDNRTPVHWTEAADNLVEEYIDVAISYEVLRSQISCIEFSEKSMKGCLVRENKVRRWAKRLGYGKEEQQMKQ